MKKWLLLIIFGCAALYAKPERVENLTSKVILENTDGYFVLSDGSCWKVIRFSTRWRSFSEWWNNVKLIPENYECVPNDWYLGAQIEAYPKYGNLSVNEADALNQEDLKQCTHLFVNSGSGQVLFAVALSPGECLVQLFKDARSEGYDKGYNKGYNKGYKKGCSKSSAESYDAGHAAGYQEGYVKGFRAAIRGEEQPGSVY